MAQAWEYEHFDMNNDPTHARGNGLWDFNVRRAIAMSVDKRSIIDAVFPGTNLSPACSLTPPGIWYAKTEDCPSYDPEGAKQLLQQAGWVPGPDGYVAQNGKGMNLELCTTSGNPVRLTELQKLQGYLKAVGIKSYIKTADASSVVFAAWASTTASTDCSINRGTYDIADFASILTGTPYGDYYYSYKSDKWPELGDHSGLNDTRLKSDDMDSALQNLLDKDVTFEEQLADAQKVQDAYAAAIPEVPIYYRSLVAGVGAHYGNYPGISRSSLGPTWNVEDWFYK
jgi:peptide/nickel transport system substrate-binding protein